MKTNNDTPALAIDWTDQEVQGVAFKQALSFSNQLRPRGFELEDLIQELGVVFCKALNAFWKQPVNGTRAVAFDTSGEPTKVAFLGFFKRCCQCKLIELDRKVQRRATVDQTVT